MRRIPCTLLFLRPLLRFRPLPCCMRRPLPQKAMRLKAKRMWRSGYDFTRSNAPPGGTSSFNLNGGFLSASYSWKYWARCRG